MLCVLCALVLAVVVVAFVVDVVVAVVVFQNFLLCSLIALLDPELTCEI